VSLDFALCSDGELAALALGGQQAAYREFLRRYKEPVYRLIRSSTGDAEEALDLTQEAFVAAFAALRRYDAERPFRLWVSRIALNKCRDWARRQKVRAFFRKALPLEDAFHVSSDEPTPEAEVGDRAALARVAEAMSSLPQKLRQVLVLRAVEGLSQAEAADALGVTEKAVETRLYRARQQLTQTLEVKV
jgi:RNA polymerase sigma-70 factor (ECF subfamily)